MTSIVKVRLAGKQSTCMLSLFFSHYTAMNLLHNDMSTKRSCLLSVCLSPPLNVVSVIGSQCILHSNLYLDLSIGIGSPKRHVKARCKWSLRDKWWIFRISWLSVDTKHTPLSLYIKDYACKLKEYMYATPPDNHHHHCFSHPGRLLYTPQGSSVSQSF